MNRKVLFIHDGPRWKNDSGEHFGTTADLDMYNRYKYLGSHVEFAMRLFKVPLNHNLLNLTNKGLYITQVTPFNRPALATNYFKSKKELQKAIDQVDLLVVRLPSTIGSVAAKYAEKINKPYLVEVVGCPWDSLRNHSSLGKIYAVFSKLKLKRLVRNAPYVTYVTKSFLQTRYPTRGKNIAISDVMIKKANPSEVKQKQESYKIMSTTGVINIGTLAAVDISYKGHDLVFKAIKDLKSKGIKLLYHIAGKGNFDRLKDLSIRLDIEDNLNYVGVLDHSEVFDFLNQIDIYIQPSRTEGLPRALVEAMSQGCACIGSDVGGIPELLDKSVLFKSKNVQDLTDKIQFLLNNDRMVQQSKRNYEVAKEYSFENLERKRKEFYNEFLASINEEK